MKTMASSLFVVGVILIGVGLALWSLPVAIIFSGLVMVSLAIGAVRGTS